MNKSPLKLIAAAGLALGLLAPAQATLLTFEDVVPSTLSTYQGFTWSHSDVIDVGDFPTNLGVPQSVVSGSHVVVNNHSGANGLSAATAFSLNSGYFTSFGGSGVPLTVTAFLNGNLVGTQTFIITDTASTFLEFDQTLFGTVTEVTFNNFSGSDSIGNYLAFDDLTINASAVGDVPEPASLALLGLGLLGLAGARRLRKG